MKQSLLDSVQANAGDVAVAENAYNLLKSQLDAIPIDSVQAANLNLRAVATVVLGVARFLEQPEVHARFTSLPREEFDLVHVRQLAAAAWAALYTHTCYLSAAAGSSEAKVPDAIVRDAAETKGRMMKVLEYHVDERVELASIREGVGHADTATDLTRLAALYSKHHDVVSTDRRLYRATDERHAGQLAAQIFQALASVPGSNAKAWRDAENRAWTLVDGHYEEVRAAGLWLFRHEDGDTKFPSLPAATRTRRRTSRAPAANPPAATESPAAAPAANGAPIAQPAH